MTLSNIPSIPTYELMLVAKITIAFVVGIIIGYDRERSGKAAGMRTQMLICVGSALIAGISVHLGDKFTTPGELTRSDPARLLAQIVTGIGFVGAGVILKSGHRVTGVTTAATLWVTAAIGIAIGSEFYLSAAVTTIFVLLLEPLAQLQYRYGLKSHPFILHVDSQHRNTVAVALEGLMIKHKITDEVGDNVQFFIYSSENKNQRLAKSLSSIPFQLEEAEE